MHTLTELRAMLDARGLSPRKALGQNFLIDQNLARKLIDASGARAGDLVLEVGPGAGALTEELVERGCEVVACELDAGLAALLEERFGDRITLVQGDCLEKGRALGEGVRRALGGRPFTLVANLPYGAASPLMAILAADHPECGGMFVTIQKEVADRLLPQPGSGDYGGLTVVVRACMAVERLATLPRECFWPRPNVTSAMVAMRRLESPLTRNPARLSALCRRLFSARRKMLGTTLGRDVAWPEGVSPDQRPETLTIEQFCALADVVDG